jgi:microcin C transport system substrate-binding protein
MLFPGVTVVLLSLCVNLHAAGFEDHEALNWQHGLSFYGDFKYPAGFAHFDYVNPDAPTGGRMVRAMPQSFNNFTPFIVKGTGAPGVDVIVEPMLYDSLMLPSGDEIGVFYGNLAGSIAVSRDSSAVRMRLRDEARWHDGVPVTAADIKFTFEHIRDNASPGVKAAYLSLKQVDVISDKEVLFQYHAPVNLNAMMALGKVAMMPEHYWRDRDSTSTTTEPPLSSGPYRVGKLELGKYIELERVEDYWGRALGLHRGKHNIDVLRFEVYRDATVQREALRKGLIDVFYETNAAQWVTGYDRPGLKQVKHSFQQYVGIVQALAFNLTMPRFQDVRVREALSLAFDFRWINRVFNYGIYEEPQSFFHGTSLAATGLPDADELVLLAPHREAVSDRVFSEPPWAGSRSASLGRREALIRAQALLADAGWQFQDGVLRNSQGESFKLEFLVSNAGGQRIRLPYVAQLKRLGIDASVRLVESAQYVNMRRENKGDAVTGSLAIAMPPNQEVPAYFGSNSRGFSNFAHLSSPVVDALIEHLLTASNRKELIAAGRALDRVLYWGFYFIPLQILEGQRSVRWDKYEQPEILSRDFGGFPSTWWWDPEKAERVRKILESDSDME